MQSNWNTPDCKALMQSLSWTIPNIIFLILVSIGVFCVYKRTQREKPTHTDMEAVQTLPTNESSARYEISENNNSILFSLRYGGVMQEKIPTKSTRNDHSFLFSLYIFYNLTFILMSFSEL